MTLAQGLLSGFADWAVYQVPHPARCPAPGWCLSSSSGVFPNNPCTARLLLVSGSWWAQIYTQPTLRSFPDDGMHGLICMQADLSSPKITNHIKLDTPCLLPKAKTEASVSVPHPSSELVSPRPSLGGLSLLTYKVGKSLSRQGFPVHLLLAGHLLNPLEGFDTVWGSEEATSSDAVTQSRPRQHVGAPRRPQCTHRPESREMLLRADVPWPVCFRSCWWECKRKTGSLETRFRKTEGNSASYTPSLGVPSPTGTT